MPDSTSGLVQQFMEASKPQEFKTSVKFRVLDQIVFEIDVNSNYPEEYHEQLYNVIDRAISSAASSIISAK
ncbi:hypothetical protein [Acinetobacter bouvetii]|uniref:Uncharacterized protein n=1 Tax=Acinetobacter bouvetii TaxID=202951 RepID=A0A811GFR4_9GAMM|nr:hypothetical protein [Acinetobacter bouvetii]CAB1222385.1 hypothetical protein SFB21_3092 [Acinetobacter bouvetii]